MTCNTRSTWQGVAATVHCTRGEKILICGIATGTAGCEGNRFPLFFVSNLEGRRKQRNETGTVIRRRDRISFMRLNLGFYQGLVFTWVLTTHYGRYTIIIINATIYLQFSYMQLIKFILYICNVYYRILFLNSVKGNSKDTFHIFVDIFSGQILRICTREYIQMDICVHYHYLVLNGLVNFIR